MTDMTKEELQQEIAKLEPVADRLGFADKAKLVQLQNRLDGMALSDLVQKLQSMPKVDADDLRAKVKAATNATANRQTLADAFNSAIGLVTRTLGIAL